ncbi:MAG: DUF839 domain-containing protein, partial [Flavobacteriales bacterium]|nr:DUF839 domain-containing protein [Flavobacteriales bacterium]
MTFSIRLAIAILFVSSSAIAQLDSIWNFTSIVPGAQTPNFIFPDGYSFQYIAETGDPITGGGAIPDNFDWTGYFPIEGRSDSGFVVLNSEMYPDGAVTIFDVVLDSIFNRWTVLSTQAVDLSPVGGTARNCGGFVTSWGTVLTCEEIVVNLDDDLDGFEDHGWIIEIDPYTKTVISKHHSLGQMKHENCTILSNNRTLYEGADS